MIVKLFFKTKTTLNWIQIFFVIVVVIIDIFFYFKSCEKKSSVKKWKYKENLKLVQIFYGLIKYHRKFCFNMDYNLRGEKWTPHEKQNQKNRHVKLLTLRPKYSHSEYLFIQKIFITRFHEKHIQHFLIKHSYIEEIIKRIRKNSLVSQNNIASLPHAWSDTQAYIYIYRSLLCSLCHISYVIN